MTVDGRSILRHVSGVEASRLGQEYVILDPTGQTLRGLNATAARVWDLLDGVCSAEEIAGVIAREYAVAEGRVLPDVLLLLTQLVQRALVEPVAPSGSPRSGS